VEVFDRGSNYDPHLDPIVRVEARRLRAKLAEYHEKTSQNGLILISFPKGSYVPVFEQKPLDHHTADKLQPALGVWLSLRAKTGLLVALAVVLFVSGFLWWVRHLGSRHEQLEFTRLAGDFNAMGRPALSLDGKLVTYASAGMGEGQPDLWVQQVSGGGLLNLTHSPTPETAPSFSADGTQIVFTRGGLEESGIWLIPTIGGQQKRLTEFGNNPRFSRDGQWIAFDYGDINQMEARIYLVAAKGGTPVRWQPDFATALLPHWSPDAKHLLFLGCSDLKKGDWDLWVAPVDGGNAMRTGVRDKIESMGYQQVFPGAWTPSGNAVIVWAEKGDTTDLLRIPLSPKTLQAVGIPQRLTQGVSEDCCPSVSADGRLAFKSVTRKTEILELPLDAKSGKQAGDPTVIAHGTFLNVRPSACADGRKVAYMIPNAANWDLRLKDLESGADRVLVSDVSSKIVPYPAMRPDNLKVAFPVEENGKPSIFLVDTASDVARKSPERLCEGCGTPFGWSPDGAKLLYFPPNWPGPSPICLLQVETRLKAEVVKHSKYNLVGAQFSPDGRWISFQGSAGMKNGGIFVVPYEEDTVTKESDFIEVTGGAFFEGNAFWSSDGSFIYFLGHRHAFASTHCIWAQRLDRLTKRPIGKPFAVYHDHTLRANKMGRYVGGMWMSQGGNKLFFSASRAPASIWMTQLKDLD